MLETNASPGNSKSSPSMTIPSSQSRYMQRDLGELPSKKKNWPKEFKDLILTDPKELHGSSYVTEDVKQSSKITAAAINVSSSIDGVSIFPLLLYSFKDMGIVGFMFAAALALALTKFSNGMGKAVATRKPGNLTWSTCGGIALVVMNIIMSTTSLIAPELSLNKPHLAELKAQELVDQKEQKVKQIKPILRAANEAEAECKRMQTELKVFPEGSVQRNDLYIQAYGTYSEKNQDWRQALQQGKQRVPFCPLFEILKADALKTSQATQEAWEKQKTQIVQSASYLVGIKQTMPELYQQHFDANGQLISGIEATRLALESTTLKLMTGQWNALGFSLFFFLVSVVTSAGACSLAIAHSFREDTQLSFDESLQIAMNDFLED